MKKILFFCIFIMMPFLLSGCDDDKRAEAEVDAVVRTVDEDALSEENKERGTKSAYNDAGFFDRVSASMKSMISKDGKSKYDYFEEAHPDEVLKAQYADYYTYDADEGTVAKINSKSTAIYWRSWLRDNMTIILLVLCGVSLLVFLIFFMQHKPQTVVPTVKKPAISEPVAVASVPVVPIKDSGKLSINYERGLRIYCKNNGKDYDDVLSMYGGDAKRAFETINDFGSLG